MRLSMRIALFAFFVAICFLAVTDAAMGGKGGGGRGGRGGGNGHGHSHGGGHGHSHGGNAAHSHGHGGSHSHHVHKPKVKHDHHQSDAIERTPKFDNAARESHPWSMQRANEERKLKHRMDVADKLDRLSKKNGNEHLKDTAERMRERAQDQYDKRLAKIDSKDPNFDPDDPEIPSPGDDSQSPLNPPPPPGSTVPDGSLGSKLTGRENAYYRQVRNEERKFSQRMEMAEQLRTLGEQQNDPSLLAAADRLEQHGLDHFQQRMAAIRSFQDRHGLIVD